MDSRKMLLEVLKSVSKDHKLYAPESDIFFSAKIVVILYLFVLSLCQDRTLAENFFYKIE